MRFSERHGHKIVRESIQIESMDEPLRNALWNLLKIHIWDRSHRGSAIALCKALWSVHLKKPLDTLDYGWSPDILSGILKGIRPHFFDCEWYEVYDFIEFCANNYSGYRFQEDFIKSCNATLEREMSAYRFINGLISPIAEQEQLDEIEKALDEGRESVRTHIKRSLELLSNRENPDYRNSIKESISAVESLVGLVLGRNGTLSKLINKLEGKINLHPDLRKAFFNLYGYASDKSGIRHGLKEPENIQFEEAKFSLVVCSAFINFVESKVEKIDNNQIQRDD